MQESSTIGDVESFVWVWDAVGKGGGASGFKSAHTTKWAPSAAKARAMARPRPEEEPIIMHVLSFNCVPVGDKGAVVAIVVERGVNKKFVDM